VYRSSAVRFTIWENHQHQSTHAASLTLKVFALSAVVAYLGLALSAFVYVPFGESVMDVVQVWLFNETSPSWNIKAHGLNHTMVGGKDAGKDEMGMWDMDTSSARRKLNPSRLQDEMFAYTVTNQIVDNFLEVGLPYILRAINTFRNRKRPSSPTGKKKRVGFEDEARVTVEGEGKEEREFLEKVRSEVALPEYELYEDYSEMVTQFGYVALWSTIWPLAPGESVFHAMHDHMLNPFHS
jgi:anoctamin-10